MFKVKKKNESVMSEAYKTLRSSLQYSLIENGLKTILVTSANSKEGKTTIASNIALEFSKIKKSVILIECNFRNPSIKERFKLNNEEGFSNVILGKRELKWVIEQYNDNLSIISAGTILNGATEILSCDEVKKIINILKESYDVIIIDSPQVIGFADTQILSTIADATVLVVKAEETTAKDCEESKKLLDNVGGNIVGTVLFGKNVIKK